MVKGWQAGLMVEESGMVEMSWSTDKERKMVHRWQ